MTFKTINWTSVDVTEEEAVDLIEKIFLAEAETEKDYAAVRKSVRSGLMNRKLNSKDGNYKLDSFTEPYIPLWLFHHRYQVWIYDEKAETCYYYGTFSNKTLKKALDIRIAEYRKYGRVRDIFMYCPNCKKKISNKHKFCPQCGVEISEGEKEKIILECENCHAEYQKGQKFCKKCGRSLTESSNKEN